MWAALRHRPGHAVGLLLLSALLIGSAAFAPVYERSVEGALLVDGLQRTGVDASAVQLVSTTTGGRLPDEESTRSFFPPALAPLYDAGRTQLQARVSLGAVGSAGGAVVRAYEETCRGVVVRGRCPSAPGEVLVSEATASQRHWPAGTRVVLPEALPPGAGPGSTHPLTVVGSYRQVADPTHWLGIVLAGRAGAEADASKRPPVDDDLLTAPATLSSGWQGLRVEVDHLLDRTRVDPSLLRTVPGALDDANRRGSAGSPPTTVTSRIGALVADVAAGEQQAGLIIPLVMVQLAVVAAAVLVLVASASLAQRRPEIALRRLRGAGGRAAIAPVLVELGVVVLAGVPLGVGAALALDVVARRTWLPAGIRTTVPGSTWWWTGSCALTALAVLPLVARPLSREPVAALLRQVPARRSGWGLGLLEAAVVTAAAAAVVSVASGNLAGPLVLLAPTVLALAVGLVVSRVLGRLAGTGGHRALRRGRFVVGLAATRVSRTPSLRHVVSMLVVATALTVFASDAVDVGARNRAERAALEAGATDVLSTSATTLDPLLAAVRSADPTGSHATPVVIVAQPGSSGVTTMAVDPGSFARVALRARVGDAPDGAQVLALSPSLPPETVVRGRQVSVVLDDLALSLVTPGDAGGSGPGAGLTVTAQLTPPGQGALAVELGTVPVSARGPVTLVADASCDAGCRLTGLSFRIGAGVSGVGGSLTLRSLSVDGGPPTGLGPADAWLSTGDPGQVAAGQDDGVVVSGTTSAGGLRLTLRSLQQPALLPTAASGGTVPALLVGGVPPGGVGDDFAGPGLDGVSTPMHRVGDAAYLPRGLDHAALVDVDRLALRSVVLASAARTEVWTTDAATAAAVRSALSSQGLQVTGEVRRDDVLARYDSSASAWGLRLALVVGLLAVLVAGLVLLLVAAASWRSRLRDDAALTLAGVAPRRLTAATAVEQVVVVVVGVVAGTVCGLLGAAMALPLLPLFPTPSTVLPVDTAPAAATVSVVVAGSLLLLLAVGALVTWAGAARADVGRVARPW